MTEVAKAMTGEVRRDPIIGIVRLNMAGHDDEAKEIELVERDRGPTG
jgi:hypothetical protein